MPSLLQQQLQQVSATWGTASKRQRGRPSLLYTAQEAADVDLQTLFELAEEGLEQLCKTDSSFEPFQQTLFSQAGSETNRDAQTKHENEVLDASLEAYLKLLTDHFLSAPAFQTLEYLVRRYRVHEFNVDALIACALPFHATNHFVRLVQILHLDQSLWRFLSPMQKSGAAMPRSILVQRCLNDQAVLQAICENAVALSGSKRSSTSSSMQSFYAVVVCELMTAMQPVKEETVRLLLPYLLAGLGAKVSADYHAATMMIVTLLASKATLSEGLLAGLLSEMVRHVDALQAGQVVMALCHIAVVQPQITQTSKKLVKRVLNLPDLLPHLERLAKKGMALGPLLAWMLPHLGAGILDKKSWMDCAVQMVNRLPLGMHAQLLASTVLHDLPKLAEAQRQSLTPLIRAIDVHFPQEMDAAVNQLLQHGHNTDKAAAQQVLQLMQEALAGSAHAPLADAQSTLAVAVDAPSAEMRVLALKELDSAQQSGNKQHASDFMQSVLLRRLADDEPQVLDAALSLPSLRLMPRSVLYDAVAGIMLKYSGAVANLGSSQRKAWRLVAQKALQVMDHSFLAKQPALWQSVMLQLLDKSMVVGHNHQLASTAVSLLKKHDAILLSGFSTSTSEQDGTNNDIRIGSPDSIDEIAPGTPNRPHKSSKEADLAFNHSLISALAQQLADGTSEALSQTEQLILAASDFPMARYTLLLAFVQACHISKAPAVPAKALLRIVRAMWPEVQTSGPASGAVFQPVVDEEGHLLAGHLKALNKKPAKAHAALLQHALLVALQTMPASDIQAATGDLILSLQAGTNLAAALLHLTPQPLFQQHCQALLEKVNLPAALLSSLAGAPTGASAPAVPLVAQEHALQLLPAYLSQAPTASAGLNTMLPQLLAACAHPVKHMRQLAMQCLATAASTGQTAKLIAHVSLAAASLDPFVNGLLQHESEIVDDEQGLVQVVKKLLSTGRASDQVDRLSSEDSAAVTQYLLHVLLHLHSSNSASAAMVVLFCTSASQPSQRLQSAVTLLQHLPLGLAHSHGHDHTAQAAVTLTPGQVHLVNNLLQLFTAEAFSELLAHKPRSKAAKAAQPVISDAAEHLVVLTRFGADQSQDSLAANIRQAAFHQLTADVYACLPVQQQMKAFLSLMNGSSRDPTEAVRQEARTALSTLPLTAASLAPLLADFDGIEVGLAATPAASVKTRKRAKSSAAAFEAVEQLDILQLAGESTGVALCISVLELLQWKEDVQDEAQLLDPLSQVLRHLLDSAAQPSPAVERKSNADDMDTSNDEGTDAESVDVDSSDTARRPSNYGYAIGLVLQAVHNIAGRAPDDTVKNLDTGLILECARQASDGALRNAALALVSLLAGKQPDNTLKHVLEVISVVGSSASQQQDSHSHQVAAATLAALVPAWLQAGKPLAELTSAVVAPLPDMLPHTRLPLLSALLTAVPKDRARPILLLQLLQQALEAAPHQKAATVVQGSADAQNVQDQAWLVDLANAVCQQASMLQRFDALTALMQQALQASEDHAAQALPALAVTFAATQVQEAAVGVSAARSSDEVQAAFAAMLEQTITHLQLLGGKPVTSKHEKRAHKTAEDAAYQLLDGLAKVMDGTTYIGALLKLLQHPSEAVIRRALRLIADIVAKASQAETAPGGATAALALTATAAEQLCSLAPALLQTENTDKQLGPATRQAALLALSQVGQHVGQTNPQPVIALLPSIVAAAKDVHRSVRSSAMAAAAACLVALGSAVLPLLPTLVPAILEAAQTAVDGLPKKDTKASQEEVEASEAAALEAASALAAVGALVDGLKAFLSPYLAALLQLLFSPHLLACPQAGCSGAAARIRIQLAAAIPPRLLLAPLFGYLDGAIQEGEAAAMSLLAMVQCTFEQMDASTAGQHAEACYSFLLQALDTRQRRPDRLPSVEGVERSSVAVLLALTMKLSEAKFKPLFLRLLDWASTAPAAEPDSKPLGRQVALFSTVLGLSERLRSVFVPYFRYLMDPIAAHLGGSSEAAAGDGPRKKRKKRSSTVAVMGDSSDPQEVEDTWRLRLKVVQALHGCFQNDTISFLDEARFHRLLPLLVQQLSMQPPADLAAVLVAQQAAASSSAAQHVDAADNPASSDVFGDAVVAALVQMAVTANNDTLWKPLNHQVLMITRSPAVEERMRALAAVSGLVSRMREEYLLLLPEALPFLAELLEDPEHEIVTFTQQLIKKLEDLSGESLEQYLTV